MCWELIHAIKLHRRVYQPNPQARRGLRTFLCIILEKSDSSIYKTQALNSTIPHQSPDAHPLHPQCLHSTIFPYASLFFGTLQIQTVPKECCLLEQQFRQHSLSYPFIARFRRRQPPGSPDAQPTWNQLEWEPHLDSTGVEMGRPSQPLHIAQ